MACQCKPIETPKSDPRFKKALWWALGINLTLFFVEVFGGAVAHSAALWADALDFFGDSVNYALSLFALSLSMYWRSSVALIKGWAMIVFGIFVLGKVGYSVYLGIVPEAMVMGMVAVLALLANVICAVILYTFRSGDANMQSVWLCSRNDAIGNLAVLLAAIGVFGTGSLLPDVIVAVLMAVLAFSSGFRIVKLARQERLQAQTISCTN